MWCFKLFQPPLQGFNSPNRPLNSAGQYQLKYIKSATATQCYGKSGMRRRIILWMSLESLAYLHEHAESSFKEISETWWHMLNIKRIRSFRITDLFHYLFQQRFVRSLHKNNTALSINLFRLGDSALLNILLLLKLTKITILERTPFRELKDYWSSSGLCDLAHKWCASAQHQPPKTGIWPHIYSACVYYMSKGRQGKNVASSFSGIFLEVAQKGTAIGMTLCCPSCTQKTSFPL